MSYKANAVVGSPDAPATLIFASGAEGTGRWFTVGGLPLAGRPAQPGVYIYNGRKVVVK